MEYHDVLPNISLLAGWVFMHKIWPGRRAHCVKYENINNSDLDGMSLASFCQSKAVYIDEISEMAVLYYHLATLI